MSDSELFDARIELVSLYRAATDFDEKFKALTLMEKVGGFFGAVKSREDNTVRDPNDQDPIAAAVRAQVNGTQS